MKLSLIYIYLVTVLIKYLDKMCPSKKQIEIKKFFQPHISYLKNGIPFNLVVQLLKH